MNFLDSIWLIPLFPFAGALLMLLFGKRLPKSVVNVICPGAVLVSFIFSLGAVLQLAGLPERVHEVVLYTWLPGSVFHMTNGQMGTFQADWGFLLDPLSSVMILVVTGVGFLIHVYSTGYMAHEGGYYRFFGYLNLFMFSMLTLVLGNNYLLLFVGWEGVGLCSYLLIGFYFLRTSATKAGMKAFIVNRIGDAGFVLGMLLLLATFGSLRFTRVFETVKSLVDGGQLHVGDATVTLMTLLLFVGATGKSAQVPLYVWLPDAMEGPTPVSALIHAATMVTAGVYMVARSNLLFSLAPTTMAVVAAIGAFTAIFAATIGIAQNDIKRVLAYSTVSQLGYMFLACGVGAFGAGVFHLMTHAFFKALLFLGAGSVIHSLSGEQDMRKMGALAGKIPKTHWTFMFASLAIIGTPLFSGFFSKDEILWRAWTSNPILWVVGFITAGLTALYIWRLVFLTFYGKSRVDHEVEHHIHESPPSMWIPLACLAVLSLIGGWIGWPSIIGGSNHLEHWLEPVFENGSKLLAAEGGHSSFEEMLFMTLSVAMAGAGVAIAYYFFLKNPAASDSVATSLSGVHKLLQNKYYVDEVYTAVFVEGLAKGGGTVLGQVDAEVVDGGVNGAGWLTRFSSSISIWWDTWIIDGAVRLSSLLVKLSSYPVRIVQTGRVQAYALFVVVGALAFFGYYLAR